MPRALHPAAGEADGAAAEGEGRARGYAEEAEPRGGEVGVAERRAEHFEKRYDEATQRWSNFQRALELEQEARQADKEHYEQAAQRAAEEHAKDLAAAGELLEQQKAETEKAHRATEAERQRGEKRLELKQIELDELREAMQAELMRLQKQLTQTRDELAKQTARAVASEERERHLQIVIKQLRATLEETKVAAAAEKRRLEAEIVRVKAKVKAAFEQETQEEVVHTKKFFCYGCQQHMVHTDDMRKPMPLEECAVLDSSAPGRSPLAGAPAKALRRFPPRKKPPPGSINWMP